MCMGGGGSTRYETEQERDARTGRQAAAQTKEVADVATSSDELIERQQAASSSQVNPVFKGTKLGKQGGGT